MKAGVTLTCTLHRVHRPKPLTIEQHHIIPQAWQKFDPDRVTSLGLSTEYSAVLAVDQSAKLWDPRTVALCPSSHRNVHYWIVALMKAGRGTDDPLVAKKALVGNRALTREQAMAYDALTRFRATGRSLADLFTHGVLGYA
jgi:hypothetical protein